MTERGKIAKIELESLNDCDHTYMVFDRVDDGGISVSIEAHLQCDLEGVLLLVEAGDFDAVVTIESDGAPQTDLMFFSQELLKIRDVAKALWKTYDLSRIGEEDNPESPRVCRRPIASFHATISSTSRCA